MRTAATLLAAAALAVVSLAAKSDVETLTAKNFDSAIRKSDLVLVKFFAPWCGHCQAMADDYKKAATALKGKAILADVDATKEESLAKKYNVEGFPTLKLFKNGEELTDYKGGRDTDSMIKFVEGATKPAFTTASSAAEFKKFVEENKGMNILVGAELDDAGQAALTKASFGLRDVFPDTVTFVAVKSAADAKDSVKLSKGGFALLAEEDGKLVPQVYDEESHESVEKFVKIAAMPVFAEFTQENADLFTELTTPLVVGFFKSESAKKDPNFQAMEKVARAKKGNGKLTFAWVDGEKLASFQEYVGLKDAKLPICGYSFADDQKYLLPKGTEKLTEKDFSAWVDKLGAGELEAATKSQPIPEKQEESGPYVVVGDSWEAAVEDPTLDVLVAQVAPWCGHCKAMKPGLIRAADELRKAGIKTVRIATMDATENDAPVAYKAKGFPTVHFFPGKKGAKGVEFEGDRSSKAIIDYVKENAATKFEFDTSKLGEDPAPEEEDEEGEPEGEEAEGEEGEHVEEDAAGEEHADEGAEKDEL